MAGYNSPMREVLIFHGWDDNGESYWIPWLKTRLESIGYRVHNPSFPNPQRPVLKDWLAIARGIVSRFSPDHSIVAYSSGFTFALQLLTSFSPGERIDRLVGLAPFDCALSIGAEETIDLYRTPIDYPKVRGLANHVSLIASDNDPYIPLGIPKKISRELNASLQIIHAGLMNAESKYLPQEVVDIFTEQDSH